MNKKIICHTKLPRAGLGNKIFTWMHGVIFSHVNGCEHITTNWVTFHIGPILRHEQTYRFYRGYFKQNIIKDYFRIWYFKILKKTSVLSLSSAEDKIKLPAIAKVYEFREYPSWKDYFAHCRKYRHLLVRTFYEQLTDRVKKRLEQHPPPMLSVHVRRGDFQKFTTADNFSKTVSMQTPEEYFVETIKKLREIAGKTLKVTVFTDGRKEELPKLFNLHNVEFAKEDLDIIHLLLMSRSKIIVPSAGSGFSYWASFISNAVIIRNPNHGLVPLRDEKTNKIFFEGVIPLKGEVVPSLLKKNLQEIGE